PRPPLVPDTALVRAGGLQERGPRRRGCRGWRPGPGRSAGSGSGQGWCATSWQYLRSLPPQGWIPWARDRRPWAWPCRRACPP
ncbi:hypothetical protein CSC81_17670, partial [Tenacibaculum discolor]